MHPGYVGRVSRRILDFCEIKLGKALRLFRLAKTRRQVSRIISDPTPPKTLSDKEMELLQRTTEIDHEYSYDPHSLWVRSRDRLDELLDFMPELKGPGLDVAEIGCGDGTLGSLLAWYGHRVDCYDSKDWRVESGKNVNLVLADICSSDSFPAKSYDLVFSFNTFEHLPDPARAYRWMRSALKPHGKVYLHFGPLYCSAKGLHAWTMRMPYPQFLFSASQVDRFIKQHGVNDLNSHLGELQFLNELRLKEYEEIFGSQPDRMEICKRRNVGYLDFVLRFPQCFRGRGLSLDDLEVQSLLVKSAPMYKTAGN